MENEDSSIQPTENTLDTPKNGLIGILAGLGAAIGTAIVWAFVTVITQYQIGWMAIGVGFAVGSAIRIVGKVTENSYKIISALLSLFGCLLGNFLIIAYSVQSIAQTNFKETLSILTPSVIFETMKMTFQPMDVLFYGLAVYFGYLFVNPPQKKQKEQTEKK